ncbi:GIY-YIG nuclease family protein [Gordonia soli]|uniref:GIY-YIG domain-containing protein n=1 Tax=Gordonia soli NBRC 108243 TaxID=1223545 RepID=M0QR65_9ACTN|nr:GIY-YIG nuclease family protein [Gordonia soli]GAC69927.1 hypothetical protein GS4_29_00260 [Gordonia soli NBRC 108243]
MKGETWVWNPHEGHRYDPKCCVYRVYDPDTHELLYVGQTIASLKSRVKSHAASKSWFVWPWNRALVTYEEHPDQWATIIAEAQAIQDENPRYNVERPNPRLLSEWRAIDVAGDIGNWHNDEKAS